MIIIAILYNNDVKHNVRLKITFRCAQQILPRTCGTAQLPGSNNIFKMSRNIYLKKNCATAVFFSRVRLLTMSERFKNVHLEIY